MQNWTTEKTWLIKLLATGKVTQKHLLRQEIVNTFLRKQIHLSYLPYNLSTTLACQFLFIGQFIETPRTKKVLLRCQPPEREIEGSVPVFAGPVMPVTSLTSDGTRKILGHDRNFFSTCLVHMNVILDLQERWKSPLRPIPKEDYSSLKFL